MHGSHSGKQRKPKKAKIKKEKEEVKAEVPEDETERDLTHYIRDRVALMKQAFCVLRDRELLAMAPACLRSLTVDDLQELCLDEVLGISSKRLRATLDGYDCPSDTDSSQASQASPLHQLETISLDSISSEDEQPATKAKPKKKSRHHSRRKHREDGGEEEEDIPEQPVPRGPAGMTVLELLELQARARAIRAQLQAVHAHTGSDPEKDSVKADDSADEVVIKEEPPEVVEVVSSEDDGKPDQNKVATKSSASAQTSASSSFAKDRTKSDQSVSTLIISMPASSTQHPPRKIKLKRNNLLVSVSNVTKSSKPAQESAGPVIDLDKGEDLAEADGGGRERDRRTQEKHLNEKDEKSEKDQFKEGKNDYVSNKDVSAKQTNKRLKNKGHGKISKKRKSAKSKGSDEDEIMLELSDTEKMDLLDSFNSDSSSDSDSEERDSKGREEFDNSEGSGIKNNETFVDPGCAGVIDLDSSGEVGHRDNGDGAGQTRLQEVDIEKPLEENKEANEDISIKSVTVQEEKISAEISENIAQEEKDASTISGKGDLEKETVDEITNDNQELVKPDHQGSQAPDSARECDKNPDEGVRKKKKKSKKSKDSKRRSDKAGDRVPQNEAVKSSTEGDEDSSGKKKLQNIDKHLENSQRNIGDVPEGDNGAEDTVGFRENLVHNKKTPEQELSEGECSYSSDGIEITELKHDIVCISDEEGSGVDSVDAGKPKKKKNCKRKKSIDNTSRNDSSSDEGRNRIDTEISLVENEEIFMEVDGQDEQNTSHKEDAGATGEDPIKTEDKYKGALQLCDNAVDTDEVFEISDDSSGDETGNCLSKEPTTEEIEELSRKIDTEIEREEIIFEKNITGDVDDETKQEILKSVGASGEELTDSSWKERWLKSDKVMKVLATSNLCNALRKKNKELKMKLVEDVKEREVSYKPSQSGTAEGRAEDETDVLGSSDKSTDGYKECVDNEGVNKKVVDVDEDRLQTVIGDTQKKEDSLKDSLAHKGDKKKTNEEDDANKSDVEAGEKDGIVDVGSVDFYMTLASSTRYVDPVADPEEERRKEAMAKDARQLMKMYRKLLKIHKKAEGGGKKDKKRKKKDKHKKSAGKDTMVEGDKNKHYYGCQIISADTFICK